LPEDCQLALIYNKIVIISLYVLFYNLYLKKNNYNKPYYRMIDKTTHYTLVCEIKNETYI